MSYIKKLHNDIRAYKRSRVITTAIHLGILSNLGKAGCAMSISELQGRLSLSQEWLRGILNVLVQDGLVAKSGDQYQLTDLGIEADNDFILNALAGYHFYCFESWDFLPEALKSGKGGDFHRKRMFDNEFRKAYLILMDHIAQSQMTFLEAECKSILTGEVLDIGAGPSSLCRHLLVLNENLKVTALDFPEMVSTASELFKVPDKYEWVAQDFFHWKPVHFFDAIYCGHLIEYCPQFELKSWIKILRSFLGASGSMVLVSYLREENIASIEDLNLFELSTGLNGACLGYLPTKQELMDVLADVGFQVIEIKLMPSGPFYMEHLITCHINKGKEC